MTSTLIIRDATLAILGPPEPQADPAERLRRRVAEVASFEAPFLADCLDVLSLSARGGSGDPEALEALLIVALASPEQAAEKKLSSIAVARRLAAGLEKQGHSERALSILQLMVEVHPGHKALERDLAGLMRRQGMVQELVDRYIERSQQLLKQGRTAEAIAWMREVLTLDRSRRDVARTIRDLRYQEIDKVNVRRSRRRVTLVTLVGSILVSAGLLRETRLAEEYRTLPEAQDNDPLGTKQRLDAIESFVEAHPVWHGSLRALAERTALRLEVDRREDAYRLVAERREAELARRKEEADLARQRGAVLAQDGHYSAALEELRRSLELATPQWEERERVQRDIDALSAYLEDQR